eukprot:TRINITY_DN47336_c0_g1_i1.p1 TRINITY_DN47336_c0_g1~~TRINITY_DN47336_c0_g1_i1.p1  ORF type:complete len:234 (-),score=27.23 TRINITY_DN47336_c0_g1_i1:78-779(-)
MDGWTTLTVTGLPRQTDTSPILASLIQSGVGFDFVYVPWDPSKSRNKNLGLAIINFVDHRSALLGQEYLHRQALFSFKSAHPCQIQGFLPNIVHYYARHEASTNHEPLIFKDGAQVPIQLFKDEALKVLAEMIPPLHRAPVAKDVLPSREDWQTFGGGGLSLRKSHPTGCRMVGPSPSSCGCSRFECFPQGKHVLRVRTLEGKDLSDASVQALIGRCLQTGSMAALSGLIFSV